MQRRLVQLAIVVTLPIFLVLTNVRLLMSEAFLRYEYGKSSFPAPLGFTVEERMTFARASVNYLLTDAGIAALRDLADEQGSIYNERELRHMADVKALVSKALPLQIALGIFLVALVGGMVYKGGKSRYTALRGIIGGAILTWTLLGGLTLLVLLNFDWFFTWFHLIFFEGDTWLFSITDTLIRLFPIQFWSDAAILISALTLAQATLAGYEAWALKRAYKRKETQAPAVS